MIDNTHDCNFADPTVVVRSFITAMNSWEVASWEAKQACRRSGAPGSYQSGVLTAMERVFTKFCTPKERTHGRCGTFQRPPEYDPLHETIVDVTIDEANHRAYVITDREAILGEGSFRYDLKRVGCKWLIDTLKTKVDGDWQRHIL